MPLHHPIDQKSTNGRSLSQALFARISRFAPPVAARLAERVFLTPLRPRSPAREAVWLEESAEITIPADDGPLAARVWGDGPRTVLLVHGWSGRGSQLGAFAAPLVAAGYRVVAWDARGHGRSPGRTSSMPQLAAGVAAAARHAGRVEGVIAHSLGAAAALLAMERHDVDPDWAVFLAPPSDYDAITSRFGEMTGFSADAVAGMRSRISRRFDFSWSEFAPLRLARHRRAALLVVHDSSDRHIPWTEGAALVEAWPDARLHSTTGLGHHRLLRDPEVVAAVVEHVAGPNSSPTPRAAPIATAPEVQPTQSPTA